MKNIEYFEASGYSMEPLIKNGDRLLITAAPFAQLRKGDLVLAQLPAGKTCHRIVGFAHGSSGKSLLLRGDASFSPPDEIDETAYLGKVAAIITPDKTIALDTATQRVVARAGIYLFPLLMSLRRALNTLLGRR